MAYADLGSVVTDHLGAQWRVTGHAVGTHADAANHVHTVRRLDGARVVNGSLSAANIASVAPAPRYAVGDAITVDGRAAKVLEEAENGDGSYAYRVRYACRLAPFAQASVVAAWVHQFGIDVA